MSMIEIEKALKQLRLSGVRATLETRLLEAQAANLSFLETFSTILQDELDRRQSRLLERRFSSPHAGVTDNTSILQSLGESRFRANRVTILWHPEQYPKA